jgi:hypothetical protein
MRFDVFNTKMAEGEKIDVAYVGLCDSLEKICTLEKETGVETILVKSKGKSETISVATGEVVSAEEVYVPVEVKDTVTHSRDFASFVDPENAQGYKAATDRYYFGRIDTICGYGPEGIVGQAYDFKGSDMATGVAMFEYNLTTTSDCRLVFAGWSLVWGGIEKYVWSADEGKTWNDIELYKRDRINTASEGMCKHPANLFGNSAEQWQKYAENSSYQGSTNGPGTAYGLAADLTEYLGQTVNVTFAAVCKEEPDTLCILAHVNGIEVVE